MSALFKRQPAHPLGAKLAIVTAIKLLGLLALWWAFFSGNGESITPDQAASAILHPKISHSDFISKVRPGGNE
jgi:hypothetical protein